MSLLLKSLFARDLLVCFSLMNLCFLKVWARLLDRRQFYFDPGWQNHQLLALLILTTALAVLFAVAAQLVRKSANPRVRSAAYWLFLLAFLITFDQAGTALARNWGMLWVSIMFLVCIATPLAYLRWQEKVRRALIAVLLIVSPFTAFVAVQAAYSIVRGDDRFRDKAVAPMLSPRANVPRVVWIVFDELDERVAFEERPNGESLPEFDRFRRESLFASKAYPPANGTLMSIPALLCGKPVAAVRPSGADKLLLRIANTGNWVSWSTEPNIFTRARQMGINSALVGWYHPYCRVIADSVQSCTWTGGPYREMFQSAPYTRLAQIGVQEFLEVFGSPRLMLANDLKREVKQHVFLTEKAKQVLADPAYALIFLHFSVPHPPGLYDRRKRTLTTDKASYLDNLFLADRTLGELRSLMDRDGTWDNAVVLITSDHWFRVPMWQGTPGWTNEDEALFANKSESRRVPFMLKFPGQRAGSVYDEPFNTVITSDLLIAILQKQITDAHSAARWIESASATADQTTFIQDEKGIPVVFRLPELLP